MSASELIAALDADGRPLPYAVRRGDAHRRGIWHRSISVFVLNRFGEVLIERRSESKDLFPGFYDILGGHLQPGQHPADAAVRETREEIDVDADESRFEALTPEDGLIERVVLPEHGIVNLERKTVYLLRLTDADELAVRLLSSRVLRLTARELEEHGTAGEVSQIQFWSWERLSAIADSTGTRPLASGTLSAMGDQRVRHGVGAACAELRLRLRRRFRAAYPFLVPARLPDDRYDQELIDRLRESPERPATPELVSAVFENGVDQSAGAYVLGRFRQLAVGDGYWEPKLHDSEDRYVRNLVAALGFGRDPAARLRLDEILPQLLAFVAELMNLPLANGARFRDRFGNLKDIAAARHAALVWLEHDGAVASGEGAAMDSMRSAFLTAGRELLHRATLSASAPFDRLRTLLVDSLGAAAADFNNPTFQSELAHSTPEAQPIARFLHQHRAAGLSDALGGDRFLQEFHESLVASRKPVAIAYLTGNAAQGYLSLALVQEILAQNPNASVSLVAKSGEPGNELTITDVRRILADSGADLFSALIVNQQEGRLRIVDDGPRSHGLDPGDLSDDVARELARADVIVAEGQAYAEIRGWMKRTYIAFRVNGRVAEAIHGVSRQVGACGFVRLTPGVNHFQDFMAAMTRTIVSPGNGLRIPAAAQTTSEYVRAILSENLDLLAQDVFHGDYVEARARIRTEAARLGRTFAGVIAGAASQPPDTGVVERAMSVQRFPVFACGGGGGFSSVTLRALRQLGLPVVAGVPSTDDGGSTGELQHSLRDERGFVFGVGDMAAIIQDALAEGKRAVLAFRFEDEPESLPAAVMKRIAIEVFQPTYAGSPIGALDDFLSFCCDQLNLARIIQSAFKDPSGRWRIAIRGASIRNLNVIAAYELCGALGTRTAVRDANRSAAFYVLQKALGIPPDLLTVPVTYEECQLVADYERPISEEEARAFGLDDRALSNGRTRVHGQHRIDTLSHAGRRQGVDVLGAGQAGRPTPNPEYLSRLRAASLFVMGAGSLIGSQLSQLAVAGVVDVLLERPAMRRVLVLNHVRMDETLNMSVRDHVELITRVATVSASKEVLDRISQHRRSLRISDLFTDIVVPRTVARELEQEMAATDWHAPEPDRLSGRYVDMAIDEHVPNLRVFCNRYVRFLLERPDVRTRYAITAREIEVLSYLDQPPSLYQRRSEGGRYRGALFATTADIEYLEDQGIQRRSIHEVDSIGQNWKFVKAAGTPSLEFFPGLVPEALLGIFRIALERSGATAAAAIDRSSRGVRATPTADPSSTQ